MSSASDISNLFEMLGVSPSHYQEVERTEQVQGSRGRWSMPTMPAQADTMGDDAASDARAAAPVVPAAAPIDATEPALAEPPPVASAVCAAESNPVSQLQAASEQPAFQSDPEPAAARQQPDSLSAVFARLRGCSTAQEDVARRQPS